MNIDDTVLPAVVPHLIAAHAMMIHERAQALREPAKLVVTGFGEKLEKADLQAGSLGLRLPPKVIHVEVGAKAGIVEAINRIAQLPHYNVYMPLSAFRPDLAENAKGGEADVVACFGLVADFDDKDAARWAERLPLPPQYVLETSAGRFQAFYLFDKPAPLAAVKPIAERLKLFAACDHGTSDISHVWRIPGTLNWPNAKKVGEGRSTEPQQVKVVQAFDGSTISLEKLGKSLPEGATPAGVRAKTRGKSSVRPKGQPHRAAIFGTRENLSAFFATVVLPDDLQEEIKKPAEGDRSNALFKVITKLIELGHDDQKIENIIHAQPEGIGAKYVNRNDLDREISRIRAKTAPQDEVAAMVQEINENYAVVDDNGRTVVIYRQKDELLNRMCVVRASFQDFRNLHSNEQILTPDGNRTPRPKSKANIWLNHPDRRTYKKGVRFLPGTSESPEGVFNLWAGWGVEPRPGNWSLMQQHI
ncbi:MAG TPA: DNA-primase RepB domain-containing protein, partial [Nitrospira sp.]|nr:DNA-primase RepB domain-containing protein [Nitrospira sp.]